MAFYCQNSYKAAIIVIKIMKLLKKVSLIILITAYLYAGINHFRASSSYRPIIPAYIPYLRL
jgi:uncharacterized membrane protein